MGNSKGDCIYVELRGTVYSLSQRHAPSKFATTSGTKRKGTFYMRGFGALAPPNHKARSR